MEIETASAPKSSTISPSHIRSKGESLNRPARIGGLTFSRTRKTLGYTSSFISLRRRSWFTSFTPMLRSRRRATRSRPPASLTRRSTAPSHYPAALLVSDSAAARKRSAKAKKAFSFSLGASRLCSTGSTSRRLSLRRLFLAMRSPCRATARAGLRCLELFWSLPVIHRWGASGAPS